MSKKIWIDTDGAADDVRAISIALQHPDVEIPIYKGAETPFIGHFDLEKREKTFFGQDGLGDSPDEFPQVSPDDWKAHREGEHAALVLTRIFAEQPCEITLACIGPLTNIALALKLERRFAGWPRKVVVMGGNIHAVGNVSANSTAEFNFSYDPEAAHIVLKEMECEKIIIPWETFILESNKKTVDFHRHLTIDHPLANFFETCTRIGRKYLENVGRQFSYCDEVCIGVAINPDGIIVTEKVIKGVVELCGTYTRGQLALAWVETTGTTDTRMTELRFVMDYNAPNLDRLVHETIHRCKC